MEIRSRKHVRHYAAGFACRMMLMALLTAGSQVGMAQLKRFSIPREAETVQSSRQSSARIQQSTPLALPFWDDFSQSYLGLYPDTALWEHSYSVWVNDGMGFNARTRMTATFDGLDSAGAAYNPQEVFLKGYTDSLISKPLNLGDAGEKPVLPGERNSVFLSFFYQWKGHGEAPDPGEDHLQLQFLNSQGEWITAHTIIPDNTLKADSFYTAVIGVEGDEFFHEAFQFRFRSYGRQSGPYDTWNVDYVYLNKGRDSNDVAFPDRAIASPLGTFLGQYRSVPLAHFNATRTFTTASFDISNLQENPASANYQADLHVYNYLGEAPPVEYHVNLGDSIPLEYVGSLPSGFLAAMSRKHVTTLPLPDESFFLADADSIHFDAEIILNSGDNVYKNDSTGDYTAAYEPINFRANDTVRSHYTINDFYAYDDGVAEYAAGLIETGNLVAYEFEMPFNESFPQDTLVGFDIYLPPYGITSNQTVDFFIFREDTANGTPGEIWLRIPSRPVVNKGINRFQRIRFIPALLIDEKKFFVGWKEPVAGNMLVGLDISNDTGHRMFVNTNDLWERNEVVSGSLMVRPVFGSGQVDTQVGIVESTGLSFYPNPSTGRFYIEGNPDQVEILSSTGSRVAFTTEMAGEKTLIELQQPPGLYILRYRKGAVIKSEKLIIRQH